jgi:hypothetical protein
LSKENPGKARELLEKLKAWRERVGAQMPTPNPDYDPEKDKAQTTRKKSGK